MIKSKSLSAIGTGNFGGCPKLTSAGPIGGDYSIEYACTEKIPMNAFRGYSYSTVSISSITFPSSITKIDDYAFEYCSLKDLVLPSYVEHIGSNAFAHNRGITSLTIPTTVSYIGYGACA